MPQKRKKIVWHKRKGKFIPSSVLKPHSRINKDKNAQMISTSKESFKDKRKAFAQHLVQQIKKAIDKNK